MNNRTFSFVMFQSQTNIEPLDYGDVPQFSVVQLGKQVIIVNYTLHVSIAI